MLRKGGRAFAEQPPAPQCAYHPIPLVDYGIPASLPHLQRLPEDLSEWKLPSFRSCTSSSIMSLDNSIAAGMIKPFSFNCQSIGGMLPSAGIADLSIGGNPMINDSGDGGQTATAPSNGSGNGHYAKREDCEFVSQSVQLTRLQSNGLATDKRGEIRLLARKAKRSVSHRKERIVNMETVWRD